MNYDTFGIDLSQSLNNATNTHLIIKLSSRTLMMNSKLTIFFNLKNLIPALTLLSTRINLTTDRFNHSPSTHFSIVSSLSSPGNVSTIRQDDDIILTKQNRSTETSFLHNTSNTVSNKLTIITTNDN